MKTYKFSGSTNPYIASRDIHFNGKTHRDFQTGLTYEEARKELVTSFLSDYQNYSIQYCKDEDDFLLAFFSGRIEEQCSATGQTEGVYLDSHRMQLKVLLSSKSGWDDNFQGPGYYAIGNEFVHCTLLDSEDGYEYDSRVYGIEEIQAEEEE